MPAQDLSVRVEAMARHAKEAAGSLGSACAEVRNEALERIACALDADANGILAANAIDVAGARAAVASGAMASSALDRLVLNRAKLDGMVSQVRAVAALPDPVGRLLEHTRLDQGLELRKVSCPIGLIAAVIEARPDAVTQIAALALKSGNAVLIKPGHEAARTTRALMESIHRALAGSEIPSHAVAAVEGRAAVEALLALDNVIDLVVPRGSKALVRFVQARTRIPVLGHADGICHVYIDAAADGRMATEIVVDSKVQYPAACNAVETVLVHAAVAGSVIPPLVDRLTGLGVEVRGCERTRLLAPAHDLAAATAADWETEYGDLVLAMKVVDRLEDAVRHINRHGSHHTDGIVTGDERAAAYFLAHVDSAGVFHNVSTRFADGYRYGFGAEVGISTGKLHARGPVGLDGLTTYKYLLSGSGHVVASYVGPEARSFRHERLM